MGCQLRGSFAEGELQSLQLPHSCRAHLGGYGLNSQADVLLLLFCASERLLEHAEDH
jgi:hypothetical protein